MSNHTYPPEPIAVSATPLRTNLSLPALRFTVIYAVGGGQSSGSFGNHEEKLKKLQVRNSALFLCVFILAFAPVSRPQDHTSAGSQTGTSSEKAKAEAEEPEAATSAATEALQKATQNPVASLISVPVQNNSNFGMNPGYRTQDVLNIQPVIPVGISKNWNLLVRWITPIIYQPVPSPPGTPETGAYGLGDMLPTFFISPKKPGKLIWGAGPVFQLPTATNTFLGQGKFGMGPSIVLLSQPGHWTLGVLVNNVWSVAGPRGRLDVNQFLLQYFINYNLKKGWYITWQPTLTANWVAANNNQWTVPYGGGVGRIMKLGNQPVSLTAQFYGNAIHPANTPAWTMRLQIAFLFPKLSKEEKEMLLEKKLKQLEAQPPQKN